MTRPLLPHGRDLARKSGPVLSDHPPGRSLTVAAERDPVSGRWLTGDPAGRADKGRQGSPRLPRTVALAAAGAIVAAGAVATVWIVGGDDSPAVQPPAASAPVAELAPEPAPEPTTPPPFTGARTVPITLTTTAFAVPPGFGPDPSLGSVGEVRQRSWVLTGACDGTGPCTVVHCRAAEDCLAPIDAAPTGAGEYVMTTTYPIIWQNASCSGGVLTSTITFRVSGPPEAPGVTGTWVESADPVVLPGPARCGVYLGTFTLASA